MRKKPPSDIDRGKGRPPLSDEHPTIKTTVRFDREMAERIFVVRGNESMAEFVRRATEQRLRREEARLRARFAKMDPSTWDAIEVDPE